MTAKEILDALTKEIVSGIGSAIGNDLYQELKGFLVSRPDPKKRALIKDTSFKKPDAFLAMELDRISSQAAAYLLSMPSSERDRLIGAARQSAPGDNEETLLALVRIVQERIS